MIRRMKLKSRCRYCKIEFECSSMDKISDILYCGNECWVNDWLTTSTGLVHPDFIENIKLRSDVFSDRRVMVELIEKIKNKGFNI